MSVYNFQNPGAIRCCSELDNDEDEIISVQNLQIDDTDYNRINPDMIDIVSTHELSDGGQPDEQFNPFPNEENRQLPEHPNTPYEPSCSAIIIGNNLQRDLASWAIKNVIAH